MKALWGLLDLRDQRDLPDLRVATDQPDLQGDLGLLGLPDQLDLRVLTVLTVLDGMLEQGHRLPFSGSLVISTWIRQPEMSTKRRGSLPGPSTPISQDLQDLLDLPDLLDLQDLPDQLDLMDPLDLQGL